MSEKKLITFCPEWHLPKGSSFYKLIVDPLANHIDVEVRGLAWEDPDFGPDDLRKATGGAPALFHMVPPSPRLLESNIDQPMSWAPMWDHVYKFTQEKWESFPKSLRIIAFSSTLADRTEAAGLPTLRLRYHENPAAFQETTWDQGRVMMYWNRTGMISPQILEQICTALQIDRLLFRQEPDPRLPSQVRYTLPSQLGPAKVEVLTEFFQPEEYVKLLAKTNIYLAPRAIEGVGLCFLEAMAQGCAILAYDWPTMNEYITHGEDGYLFPTRTQSFPSRVHLALRRRIVPKLLRRETKKMWRPVATRNQIAELETLNPEKVGNTARARQQEGFTLWQKQIPELTKFVLGQ